MENAITYEQPLNEIVRVCLRLEQLFHQVDYQEADMSPLGTRHFISLIINILQLLDRPDLKAKLAKELSHQSHLLDRLANTPEIDQTKLRQILKQLDELNRWFIDSSGKIGQPLREIELLNNLRLHLASPGGGCSFDLPLFHFWLNLPLEKRKETINSWLSEFRQIRAAASLILQLTRESSKSQQKTAEQGFYQELLDPQINLRLIRVSIPKDIPAYPEVSVGRHFLSIRYFSPNIHERASQYIHNFDFKLSYCTL